MEQLLMSLCEALEGMNFKQEEGKKGEKKKKISIGIDRYLDFSEAFDTVS